MAKVTVMADGIKVARAAGMNMNPVKRGKAKGWSASVARRNQTFLQSVDGSALDGFAVSASLTIGKEGLLVTPKRWAVMRDTFIKRLARMSLIRLHWVTEFQENGRPHLHLMAFFRDMPANVAASWIRHHWLQVTSETGSHSLGQHAVATNNLTGWKVYLSKHGARGARHYQRAVLPPGWSEPGRMWGKSGEWPLLISEFETDEAAFLWLRRRLRAWRVADAQKDLLKAKGTPWKIEAALKRITAARRMLKCNDRQRSELRGGNEWASVEVGRQLLEYLAGQGAMVRDWEERLTAPTQPPGPALHPKGRRGRGAVSPREGN